MIRFLYTGFVATLDKIIWYIDFGPSVHKFFLAPQVGNFRVILGKIRAVRLFYRAQKTVPAYKDFLSKQPIYSGPIVKLMRVGLNDVPEMDKDTYIKSTHC
jgi:hypothetical protein